jgi:hypothetical protein
VQASADLQSLDELMAYLGGSGLGSESAGPSGLLLEHLRAARRDLLGSMRGEYRSNLRFAKESVGCIPGHDGRAKTRKILQSLIDSDAAGDHIWSSDHVRSPGPA